MGADRSTLEKPVPGPVMLPIWQAPHLVQCLRVEHPADRLREDSARVRHQFLKFSAATAIQAWQAKPAVSSDAHETTSAFLQAGHTALHNSFTSDHYSMRCSHTSPGTIDQYHDSAMICF